MEYLKRVWSAAKTLLTVVVGSRAQTVIELREVIQDIKELVDDYNNKDAREAAIDAERLIKNIRELIETLKTES